jgi:hypothetical protein
MSYAKRKVEKPVGRIAVPVNERIACAIRECCLPSNDRNVFLFWSIRVLLVFCLCFRTISRVSGGLPVDARI